jgi:putative oxidoreductase
MSPLFVAPGRRRSKRSPLSVLEKAGLEKVTPQRGPAGGDLAGLLLRGALGATMIAHGVRHGKTLEGTARWFGSIGFREPKLQAQLSAVTEVGAGAAVLAGAAVPLTTSAMVGTMTVAYKTVHQPNGFFVIDEGWEYVTFISAAAVALSALGSGRFSVDRVLGLDHVGTPAKRALVTAVLGVGGALAQLKIFWTKPAPKA